MPALANHCGDVSRLSLLLVWKAAYCVGGKNLEKINSNVEEVYNFCTGGVAAVARRLKSTDTGSVLVPLVFPEYLIGRVITDPVGVHIREQGCLASSRKDVGYARILTTGIAI